MSDFIIHLVRSDAMRWRALECVESLQIETAYIGAGFVRNLVWDHFHGRENDCRASDVDVIWFNAAMAHEQADFDLENKLYALDSSVRWSVKNQARMHTRNGDGPYKSVSDAMKYWPETATAIAIRKIGDDCDLIAPFGFEDVLNMIVRPASPAKHKQAVFRKRLVTKAWRSNWPRVSILGSDTPV